jgi:protein-S-isoprenylcysteine O-methyltransferase Ste14
MAQFLALEKWIRLIAVSFGILAICLPFVRLWLSRDKKLRRSTGRRFSVTTWSGVFILTILYITIGILLWKPIPLETSPFFQVFLVLTGSIFYFPGIFLYLWGFKTLGSLFGVSTSTRAQIYEQHQLVKSGPYSLVRHPMYLGVILAAAGAFLIFHTWAMVLYAPSALSVILRARREDDILASEFGDSWVDYCKRVPAWMPRFTHRKEKNDEQVPG